jgi:lysophospholipase L1-like esterase
MPLRLLCALLLLAAPIFAAEEVLSDKSSLTKILGLYQKVLAGAQQSPPAPGSVICIGSSHMQFWKSAQADLAPLTVRNFGVGGSRMTHAADLFVDNLVIPFKPRAVILYEGSNDINAGTKPEAVLENFRKLYGKLHAALPQTRMYVLSVVPSPGKRFLKIAELRKTNELLAKECATQPWMKFIDITEPLIGADGQPKAECFIPGDIHMLPAGYVVWKSVIAPVIVPAEKPYEDAK